MKALHSPGTARCDFVHADPKRRRRLVERVANQVQASSTVKGSPAGNRLHALRPPGVMGCGPTGLGGVLVGLPLVVLLGH